MDRGTPSQAAKYHRVWLPGSRLSLGPWKQEALPVTGLRRRPRMSPPGVSWALAALGRDPVLMPVPQALVCGLGQAEPQGRGRNWEPLGCPELRPRPWPGRPTGCRVRVRGPAMACIRPSGGEEAWGLGPPGFTQPGPWGAGGQGLQLPLASRCPWVSVVLSSFL